MASDFQHRKVATAFAAMDADGDGYLTEGDFRDLTTRWIADAGGRHWHCRGRLLPRRRRPSPLAVHRVALVEREAGDASDRTTCPKLFYHVLISSHFVV
jgi:hypothetical protein